VRRKPRRPGGGDLVEANPRCNITGFNILDLVGKLDVLRIECDKWLDRLIWRYGIDAKLFEWSDDEITAGCPRRQAKNLYHQCAARCPDLPKVL
jgi:hypothetical protein